MKKSKITFAAMAAILLTGCAGMFGQYDIDALNKAKPAGGKFATALTSEYRDLANAEWGASDWKDGQHFAKKGLAAAAGNEVLPDEVASRRIPASAAADLSAAHDRLVGKLTNGAKKNRPKIAAKALAAYDCWLEQQEENHQPADIAACRKKFERNIRQLGGNYLVFFTSGSATLTEAASKVVTRAVREAERGKFKSYFVIGHADTEGNAGGNMALSRKRAEAVKEALEGLGVEAGRIRIKAKGETAPLVKTGDGVKEASNRRVEIDVQ